MRRRRRETERRKKDGDRREKAGSRRALRSRGSRESVKNGRSRVATL